MLVRVFDDRWSMVHLVAGIATYFFKPLALLFLTYELAELLLKHEKTEYTVGDFLEYTTGIALAHFLSPFLHL